MIQYQEIIIDILKNGNVREERTGTGAISRFGIQKRFDLSRGFPAVTTKKLFWTPVVGELLWFMQGLTNVEDLRRITWGEGSDRKTIWDENYEAQGKALGYTGGELGPVYGKQWRSFGNVNPVDQLQRAIDLIKNNPTDRRMLVSAWNPEDLDKATLPSCHYMFQFYVENDKLSLMFNMRSTDVFLG